MLQLRPTFSESWYRVVNLKPKLRATAQISRQYYKGDRWYVVRDPAGNQFHRLSDAAYRFVGLLDGTRTVGEAWDLVGGQLADDAPTQPEVIQILSQLYAANLIETDISPDATVLLRRHKQQMKRKMQGRLMNVLFPRIPIWDPDRFLVRWLPVVKPMFSKVGAIIWLIVVIAALATILPTYNAPGGLKEAANNAINPSNWIYLWLVFVFIKFIHECGHAFACRRFGGEVHEMGIMFLVFIPTPYVDASTAWAFPSKWARMFVGAAGMIVEIFFAAICAFIWRNTNNTELINQLAYNAMLIASVSTVLFNANPLLRYDGYYMLSDYLEIPNLQQKSREYMYGIIKRHVFRIKSQQPLPPPYQRAQLLIYGVLSSIYRVFIGLLIIIMVTFKVPVLGVLMALGGVITWIVAPTVKLFKYLMLEPELHRKRGRAWAFSAAVAAGIVLLIGVIRFPMSVHADAALEPVQKRSMRTSVAGFVTQIPAKDGQLLKKDDVILVASDPEMEARLAMLQSQAQKLEVRMQKSSVLDPAQRLIDQIELGAVNEQLADTQRRLNELTIRAPFDGSLIAPKLHELAGRYLPRGQEIATVAALDQLQIYAAMDQKDAELAQDTPQKTVELRLVSRPMIVLEARDVEVLPAANKELRNALLGQQAGGSIPVDPRDPSGKSATIHPFELRALIYNPDGTWHPGQRAYVRLRLEKKPLIWQWTRRFLQMIQSQNNKWL